MTAFDTVAAAVGTPVGYWKLKEASGSWADSSGNSLTAAAVGTIPHNQPSIMPNDADGCVYLDGTTRIFVNDNALLRLANSGTMVGWCRPDNVINTHLMHKGFDYGISATGSTFSGWGGSTLNQVKVGLNTYMVVSSHDKVTGLEKLYVNGSVAHTTQLTAGTGIGAAGTNPLEIGSFAGGELFVGYLQKFLIYPAALTDANVQDLYIAGALSATEISLQTFQAMPFSRVLVAPGSADRARITNLSDTTVGVVRGPVAQLTSGRLPGGIVFPQDGQLFEDIELTGLSVVHNALMGGKTLSIDAS